VALFRRRFADLVERQLALFAEEHHAVLQALDDAHDRHVHATRDDAQETFGDYQDQVDWACEDLLAMRDRYAASLDPATRDGYSRAFARRARRRFPPLADAIDADQRASSVDDE
jgi:hypothetical protein